MDYLIKKSDKTAESLGGTVGKIKLPSQSGGDVIFVGDERPLDLGDYVLVKATELADPLDPATQKRGPTTEAVDVVAQTVTLTRTTVAKTVQELNAPILSQIAAKELTLIRPMSELRRQQENADVPANDVAYAKGKIKTVTNDISALRSTLIP